MEELQVIETTSGRRFKPWASREDVQAIKQETVQAVVQAVQDPASITAITSEIASGKTAIASAINAKGGEASATESFSELAQDIQSIQTQEITIDGGDMYAKQMTGDGVLWDLYTILVQMKSQFMANGYSYNGVLYKYSALIVCEYYKGYDSLVLQGADAYFTCDGDFYNYASPNHIWHDSDNGKMNRWVCFLFTDEGARLDITNTAISPRSMYIGGHIGTIEYFVNGRLTELVCGVEDTDVVDVLVCSNFTQEWNFNCIIRNTKLIPNGFRCSSKGVVYIEGDNDSELNTNATYFQCDSANSVCIKGYKNISVWYGNSFASFISAISIVMPDVEVVERVSAYGSNSFLGGINSTVAVQVIYMPNIVTLQTKLYHTNAVAPDLIDVFVGALNSDFNCRCWTATNVLADPDKTTRLIDNIKNHILARVSDATGGTQLVFTVSTNMYNAIANENIEWRGETMTLADAFLTKNWLFAGA